MKKLALSLSFLLVATSIALCKGKMSEKDSISYALGMVMASPMHEEPFTNPTFGINNQLIIEGFTDAINKKQKFTEDEQSQLIAKFNEIINNYFNQKTESECAENEKLGKEFLEANKSKEGVIETESGLQYKINKQGFGEIRPALQDGVTFKYKGMFTDRTIFDQSDDEPVNTTCDMLVQGFSEALQLMTEGAIFECYLPSNLAYGVNAPEIIGPCRTLIFEIELLGIEKLPNRDLNFEEPSMIEEFIEGENVEKKYNETESINE